MKQLVTGAEPLGNQDGSFILSRMAWGTTYQSVLIVYGSVVQPGLILCRSVCGEGNGCTGEYVVRASFGLLAVVGTGGEFVEGGGGFVCAGCACDGVATGGGAVVVVASLLHSNLKSTRTSPRMHVASLRGSDSLETVVENKVKKSVLVMAALVELRTDGEWSYSKSIWNRAHSGSLT